MTIYISHEIKERYDRIAAALEGCKFPIAELQNYVDYWNDCDKGATVVVLPKGYALLQDLPADDEMNGGGM